MDRSKRGAQASRSSGAVKETELQSTSRNSRIWERVVAALIAASLIAFARHTAKEGRGTGSRPGVPEKSIQEIYDTLGKDSTLAEQKCRARTSFAGRMIRGINAVVLGHPKQAPGSNRWSLRLQEHTGATFVFTTQHDCARIRQGASVVVSGSIFVQCNDGVTIELQEGTIEFRRQGSVIAAMVSWFQL